MESTDKIAEQINRRVLAAREGGNVLRCHTVPHHGQYSVGKHSYDALSLLLLLHPNPSMNLVKATLWHDCAERFVGDMPAPAKWLLVLSMLLGRLEIFTVLIVLRPAIWRK